MLQSVYVIDEGIIFWPERQLLSKQEHDSVNDNNSVQLSGSASRCLELLLSKMELVTQKELYEYAWQDSGVTPTPNTLYQSISVLRRAFREIGHSEQNFILTETRKGFRFNPQISILNERRELTDLQNVNSSVSENKETKSFTSDGSSFSSRAKSTISIFLISTICLSALFINFFYFKRDDETLKLSDYKKINKIDNCTFMLPLHLEDAVIDKIDVLQLNCVKKPFNYVTAFNYSDHISIVSCNKEIKESPDDCSVLYLRNKNEAE